MAHIPSRDINGRCEGECRDLVREGEIRRQSDISSVEYSIDSPSPSVSHAWARSEAPGFLGGHV